MTKSNREFEQVSLEEQLFYRYFRPAKEKEDGEWLSPAEILEDIKKNSAIPLSNKRVCLLYTSPSQSEFFVISKHFTATPRIPPASTALKTSSINCNFTVEPQTFTTCLLYTSGAGGT